MSERLTKANLQARVDNVNRRLESRSSSIHYEAQGRNGYTALDRYQGMICMDTVTVGTKNEIGDFLRAMMVALDDATVKADV